MDRVKWIEHKGKRILLEDMSGLQESADVFEVSDASTAVICKQPEKSVLLITDVTGGFHRSGWAALAPARPMRYAQ